MLYYTSKNLLFRVLETQEHPSDKYSDSSELTGMARF